MKISSKLSQNKTKHSKINYQSLLHQTNSITTSSSSMQRFPMQTVSFNWANSSSCFCLSRFINSRRIGRCSNQRHPPLIHNSLSFRYAIGNNSMCWGRNHLFAFNPSPGGREFTYRDSFRPSNEKAHHHGIDAANVC